MKKFDIHFEGIHFWVYYEIIKDVVFLRKVRVDDIDCDIEVSANMQPTIVAALCTMGLGKNLVVVPMIGERSVAGGRN